MLLVGNHNVTLLSYNNQGLIKWPSAHYSGRSAVSLADAG